MHRPLVHLAIAGLVVAGVGAFAAGSSFGSTEPTYVVQPGDTLWSIAEEDGLTVQQLAAANDMVPSDILLAGRTLVIPSQSGPADETSAAALAGGAASGAGSSVVAACDASAGGPLGVLPPQLVASGGEQLEPIFDEWAEQYGIEPAVVEAIAWQESGWQEGIVSGAGAVGIGQILPATAEFVSADLIGEPVDLYSVEGNIRMMARFVAYLAALEDGNLCQTIAAYYEGPAELAAYGILPSAVLYVADVEALIPRFE